uniref:UPF0102 protein ENR01_01915 n=1 Tax=candidate division WWE3 bacterium TaxID=2053526 RepID=A0A831Z1D9_UNCKA
MNLGKHGEDLARKFLEKRGFRLVERNFQTPRWGEIDLVMRDGDTTVFVEVKTRSGAGAALFGGPLGSIGYFKMKSIQRAAQFYVSLKKLDREAARLDAVSVIVPDSGAPKIEHFPNISKL